MRQTQQESIVYGCIKDLPEGDLQRLEDNRQAILSLAYERTYGFVQPEMFLMPPLERINAEQTLVISFGTSYLGIEHEWERWLEQFEQLLGRMYWTSAVVHLETEMQGRHTFTWEPGNHDQHRPNSGPLRMRCEWVREAPALYG